MRPAAPRRERIELFFILCYLAQGLVNIVFEPLGYWLKDGLGLSAAQSAAFISWMTLPLLVKPLFGALSDALSARGIGRRAQYAGSCALGSLAFAAAAATPRPGAAALLACLLAANAANVVMDVACDGVMVEQGRRAGGSGRYQAVQIAAIYAAIVLTGLGGGWLSARLGIRQVFALAAGLPLLALVGTPFIPGTAVRARPTLPALRLFLGDQRCWALAGVIFLWSFSPLQGTALFYYQSQHLGLGPVFIGALSTLAGAAGMLGAFVYRARAAAVRDRDAALRATLWAGAGLSLLHLAYAGPWSAMLITVAAGAAGVVLRLALMEAAAGAVPEGAEAAGFAAFMAVFNAAASSSNAVGGAFYELLRREPALPGFSGPYTALAALCVLGAGASVGALALLPARERLGARPSTAA